MAVKGMKKKFVFQGVHMLFNGGFHSDIEWKEGEPRECRFVFIGRNIDRDALIGGVKSCQVTEPNRFKPGDLVEANVGTWEDGIILKEWDAGNPYRIELQDERKTNIWGPIDNDMFVRARKKQAQ